jgi:hypothetical protein
VHRYWSGPQASVSTGVSFPHFLLRHAPGQVFLVDPFNRGEILLPGSAGALAALSAQDREEILAKHSNLPENFVADATPRTSSCACSPIPGNIWCRI